LGQTLHFENGWNVIDASGGAAVTCIGHNSTRVKQAMMKALDNGTPYISSMMFDTEVTEEFARFLVNSTNGMMSKAVFYSSGKSVSGVTWTLLIPM
jgi:adenosylmethionine-8-amino-7-oxononanoate aminotransferase